MPSLSVRVGTTVTHVPGQVATLSRVAGVRQC